MPPFFPIVVLVSSALADPITTLKDLEGETRYLCCNLHLTGNPEYDWNVHVGTLVPYGTRVTIRRVRRTSAMLDLGSTTIYLKYKYGVEHQPFLDYLLKNLVEDDPSAAVALLPGEVRDAVVESRVEIGMMREEVLVSLGYPPAHGTPDLAVREWRYWYNRWASYLVRFHENGWVTEIVGDPVPSDGVRVR